MSCTAAAEVLAVAALLEGQMGPEADIGEKRLAREIYKRVAILDLRGI
jgi:hypothetical protein